MKDRRSNPEYPLNLLMGLRLMLIALIGVGTVCYGAGVLPPEQTVTGTAVQAPALPRDNTVDPIWLAARKEVYRSVPDLLGQRQNELRRGLRYHILVQGNPALKQVALTFDDGPHPFYTLQLLKILQHYNVKATFFLVGEKAQECPEIVRMEVAQGHEVANHTYHHINLLKVTPEQDAVEIKACGEVIRSITGKAPRYFRPPGGRYNRRVAEIAEALGYTTILWTADPSDYKHLPVRSIQRRILTRIDNGGIILIHDGIQETIDMLPGIITKLRAMGYQFVTLEDMIASSQLKRAK